MTAQRRYRLDMMTTSLLALSLRASVREPLGLLNQCIVKLHPETASLVRRRKRQEGNILFLVPPAPPRGLHVSASTIPLLSVRPCTYRRSRTRFCSLKLRCQPPKQKKEGGGKQRKCESRRRSTVEQVKTRLKPPLEH